MCIDLEEVTFVIAKILTIGPEMLTFGARFNFLHFDIHDLYPCWMFKVSLPLL